MKWRILTPRPKIKLFYLLKNPPFNKIKINKISVSWINLSIEQIFDCPLGPGSTYDIVLGIWTQQQTNKIPAFLEPTFLVQLRFHNLKYLIQWGIFEFLTSVYEIWVNAQIQGKIIESLHPIIYTSSLILESFPYA